MDTSAPPRRGGGGRRGGGVIEKSTYEQYIHPWHRTVTGSRDSAFDPRISWGCDVCCLATAANSHYPRRLLLLPPVPFLVEIISSSLLHFYFCWSCYDSVIAKSQAKPSHILCTTTTAAAGGGIQRGGQAEATPRLSRRKASRAAFCRRRQEGRATSARTDNANFSLDNIRPSVCVCGCVSSHT